MIGIGSLVARAGPVAGAVPGFRRYFGRARGARRGPHHPEEASMLDPQRRWAHVGEKPDYAGSAQLLRAALHRGPGGAGRRRRRDRRRADSTSSSPTDPAPASARGRSGPPARPGPHLEAGVDPFADLRVVDFGDAAVLPGRPGALARGDRARRSARCSARGRSRSCSAATTRSPSPTSAPCAAVHGPVGLVHFDTHTDTGPSLRRRALARHADVRLVEPGDVDPARYVQIGLRGYWPGEEEFDWQREQRHHARSSCTTSRDHGIEQRRGARRAAVAGPGPVFLSVDVDVLDPGVRPRHRHARARAG